MPKRGRPFGDSIDRPTWIRANIISFRQLLDPVPPLMDLGIDLDEAPLVLDGTPNPHLEPVLAGVVAEQRDAKGLYAKARAGELATGAGAASTAGASAATGAAALERVLPQPGLRPQGRPRELRRGRPFVSGNAKTCLPSIS